MSYEKAMKHSKSRRKGRNMYLGFDTGSSWPAPRANRYLDAVLNVRDWYPSRNDGAAEDKKHTRECIAEAIAEARQAKRDMRRIAA